MLDRLSVPRRPLDFGDYVDILRRNLSWLVAPAFLGLIVSTVVAYMLQDTFISLAMLRIVPQQISPELIQNVSAQDITDRITGMAQIIESRTTLNALINQYGLYKNEMKSEPLEDVIEQMRKAVIVRPIANMTNISGKSLPAMEVGFKYRDRLTAQKVCQELVSRFLNASSEESMATQQSTNTFLDDRLQQAKAELDSLEQKVADFQQKNAGHLPDELNTNLSEMNALENRSNSLSDAATRNTEQKMFLDQELRTAKDRLSTLHASSVQGMVQNDKLVELNRQIAQLQDQIAVMKEQFTDDYPDLQAAKDRVTSLKKQRDEVAKEKPDTSDAPVVENPSLARERIDAQGSVEAIQTQMKANTLEAQQIKRQIAEVNGQLGMFQSRITQIPAGEKEYADLLRERDVARQHYTELEVKREKADASMELEKRKQGEGLEMIDAASLPPSPTEPKRGKIIPIGAGAGLVLGVVLVGFREVKDTSLKNLKDARLYTQLSILGSIPLLENDVVVQRRKQVMWVSWATGTVLGTAIIAASVAHYYMNR